VKLDQKHYANMLLVLDYVQEALAAVPHERRREIKMGQFLSMHQFTSAGGAFSQFADQVLQRKIEQSLGHMAAMDTVEWSVSGAHTHPLAQQWKDQKTKDAFAKGSKYNEEADLEKVLNAEEGTV